MTVANSVIKDNASNTVANPARTRSLPLSNSISPQADIVKRKKRKNPIRFLSQSRRRRFKKPKTSAEKIRGQYEVLHHRRRYQGDRKTKNPIALS